MFSVRNSVSNLLTSLSLWPQLTCYFHSYSGKRKSSETFISIPERGGLVLSLWWRVCDSGSNLNSSLSLTIFHPPQLPYHLQMGWVRFRLSLVSLEQERWSSTFMEKCFTDFEAILWILSCWSFTRQVLFILFGKGGVEGPEKLGEISRFADNQNWEPGFLNFSSSNQKCIWDPKVEIARVLVLRLCQSLSHS